jgi:ABC-type multidrug transport system, ATPase and permease components
MKRILGYLKPYTSRMTLGFFIKFIGTIVELFLPWILAHMIDTVVPLKNIPPILLWGSVMLICSFIAVAANIIANRMATKVARDSTERIRQDLFEKSLSLSCSQIDKITIPSLEARLTTDTYHLYQAIGMMQRLGVRAPILLIGGVFVTLMLEPVLTIVLVSVLPFIGIIVWLVSKKGITLYTKLQQSIDNMVRTVRENISGMRVIKALSKTEYEKVRFDKANSAVTAHEKTAGYTMSLTNPAMNFLLNIGLTLVIVVGAYRANSGLTPPGKIIAFLSYFTIILNAMLAITRIFVLFSKAAASAERISEVLVLPEDLSQDLQTSVSDSGEKQSENHIVFDRVSFSYHKKKNNIHDISFKLRKGETLGILGATGSGKSTLIQLLMRLYDIDSGSITIGGNPIQSIPNEKLHSMFGVVFQNDILFADTVVENIDFGRGISQEDIETAAKLAQAESFVQELPYKYTQPLTTRGTNLSGGQRQRLLIARALAAKPEILILDDSSSALDYNTDAALRQALRQGFEDTTVIVIAQRISSVRHADHILVLEEGETLGYGTHEELLESCGLYQEIYDSQMGGNAHAS